MTLKELFAKNQKLKQLWDDDELDLYEGYEMDAVANIYLYCKENAIDIPKPPQEYFNQCEEDYFSGCEGDECEEDYQSSDDYESCWIFWLCWERLELNEDQYGEYSSVYKSHFEDMFWPHFNSDL
ncbi:MAG: hypothetical protein HQL46_14920 [Gammaproteobacteria bacterium]|nr:hypothetical protein [Gammaproteobacteria bacterium]